MRYVRIVLTTAVVVGAGTHAANAQTSAAPTWTGVYAGASLGAGMVRTNTSETVTFDTNLDGSFGDTVRTAAGANAFAPGFCGGTAINATAAAGCTDDKSRGYDLSGRLGYDWQAGRMVIGAVLEGGRTEASDAVTAFSVTPAFYTFTREVDYLAAMRGRLGFGGERMLLYATGGIVSAKVAGEYLFTRLYDEDDATVRSQGPAPATNPFILVNTRGTDMRRSSALQFQAIRVELILRF